MIKEIEVRSCHFCSMDTPTNGHYCGWCGASSVLVDTARREADRIAAVAEMHSVTRTLTSNRISFTLNYNHEGRRITITARTEADGKRMRVLIDQGHIEKGW